MSSHFHMEINLEAISSKKSIISIHFSFATFSIFCQFSSNPVENFTSNQFILLYLAITSGINMEYAVHICGIEFA